MNIINGELMPPNHSIDNNGKVYGVDNGGNTYMTGHMTRNGSQTIYNKYTSPQFISGPQNNQPATNNYPSYPGSQQQPQQPIQKPTGAYPVSKTRSNRMPVQTTSNERTVINDYSVIERPGTITVDTSDNIYTDDELMAICNDINANTIVTVEKQYRVYVKNEIPKDTLDIISDIDNGIYISTDLDEYIVKFINSLKDKTNITITDAMDFGSVKKVSGNNNIDIIKEEVKKALGTIKGTIEADTVITLPIHERTMLVIDGKITNELLGIKSLDMVTIPNDSSMYKLLEEHTVTKIVIENMIFKISDDKIGINYVNR